MRCTPDAMHPVFLSCLLIVLFLLASCAPPRNVPDGRPAAHAHLLPAGEFVSTITVSHNPRSMDDGSASPDQPQIVQALREGGEKIVTSTPTDRIYAHLDAAVQGELRRYLQQAGRWKDEGGVELQLEITHLRLRNSAAQLFLYLVAGSDELGADVRLARNGVVFASEHLSTKMQSGGVYGTPALNKRLDFLSQQIARKLVQKRL